MESESEMQTHTTAPTAEPADDDPYRVNEQGATWRRIMLTAQTSYGDSAPHSWRAGVAINHGTKMVWAGRYRPSRQEAFDELAEWLRDTYPNEPRVWVEDLATGKSFGFLTASGRPEAIVQLIRRDAFSDVLDRFGGHYLGQIKGGVGIVLARELGPGDVRSVAFAIRKLNDPDLPDRPALVADALNALAEETEQRAPESSDLALVTDEDAKAIRAWWERCGARSALLEPMRHLLSELAGSSDPRVGHAREALALLADADLLLSGIDAALRGVLAPYAAEEVDSRD